MEQLLIPKLIVGSQFVQASIWLVQLALLKLSLFKSEILTQGHLPRIIQLRFRLFCSVALTLWQQPQSLQTLSTKLMDHRQPGLTYLHTKPRKTQDVLQIYLKFLRVGQLL